MGEIIWYSFLELFKKRICLQSFTTAIKINTSLNFPFSLLLSLHTFLFNFLSSCLPSFLSFLFLFLSFLLFFSLLICCVPIICKISCWMLGLKRWISHDPIISAVTHYNKYKIINDITDWYIKKTLLTHTGLYNRCSGGLVFNCNFLIPFVWFLWGSINPKLTGKSHQD